MNEISVHRIKLPFLATPGTRFLAGLGWLIVACALFFGCGLITIYIDDLINVEPIITLCALISFFGPPLFFILMAIRTTRRGRKLEKQVIAQALAKALPGPTERSSIISDVSAIAYGADTIALLQKKRIAVIPLPLLRSSWWRIAGYDTHTIYGMGAAAIGGAIQASFGNAAAKYEAEQASGFFFKVQSIDDPLWQVQCTDEKLLRQWEEILTQAIERRSPKAA